MHHVPAGCLGALHQRAKKQEFCGRAVAARKSLKLSVFFILSQQ
jgi:hypothetical protein